LIPAGTGFRTFQESQVCYRRDAVEEAASESTGLEESFPLLQEPGGNGDQTASAAESTDVASDVLEQLLGGGDEPAT
jgi:DNA-directed RNA polymerase subunit beta'